jgi:monoamine oxidase
MLTDVTAPIIIVGAGAAGLAAARELARAGREAVVLEARDRIGGRVFTHREQSSPVPIELGAEFVHGRSPAVGKIATAANLQLYEVSERHWYFEKGKVSKSGEFWRTIESLTSDMKSSDRDQSLKEFLDTLPDDEKTARAKSMLVRYVEGFHRGQHRTRRHSRSRKEQRSRRRD